MDKLLQRKNNRLKNYDYSQAGYYFVTICTYGRKNILGDINVGNCALTVPSIIGEKVIDCWNNISRLNDNIIIDSFCLMPNHVHGIIVLNNRVKDIKNDKVYGFEIKEEWGHRSLEGVIRDFKSVKTRYYNKLVDESLKNRLWQKSFHDHIIRDEQELQNIREYISNNAAKWQDDIYYI